MYNNKRVPGSGGANLKQERDALHNVFEDVQGSHLSVGKPSMVFEFLHKNSIFTSHLARNAPIS